MRPNCIAIKSDDSLANLYDWIAAKPKVVGKFLSIPFTILEFAAPALRAIAIIVESIVKSVLNLFGALFGARNCSVNDAADCVLLGVMYTVILPFAVLEGARNGICTFFRMLRDSQAYGRETAEEYRKQKAKFLEIIRRDQPVTATPAPSNPSTSASSQTSAHRH